jgi:hypothetical protein
MTESTKNTMNALREIAPKLNSIVDNLNSVVTGIEEFLASINLGISVQGSYFKVHRIGPDVNGCYTNTRSSLCYGRINGQFRIHVVEVTEKATSLSGPWVAISHERTLWSNCTREDKILSANELVELLGNVYDRSIKLGHEAVKASAVAKNILNALGIVNRSDYETK